jgi:hypothetical protein
MDITAIGDNWFSLYNGGSSFEYNTGSNPTAQRHDDRRPSAEVFRHIDGDKVLARITGTADIHVKIGLKAFPAIFALFPQIGNEGSIGSGTVSLSIM